MAKIFDYVVKYYSPIETDGRLMMADDRYSHVREFALFHADLKMKEFLSFGDVVTIEPLREDIFAEICNQPINGYKVTAKGCEHTWRIEPRVREQKSQSWRGI